jgi:protein-S-isoprenylcysteine O-methyltransferase Ste14
MLGMLIATGLAATYLLVLIIAIALFMVGTIIRVRSEEKLLRETFGAAFEEYSNRVAAIVPGFF